MNPFDDESGTFLVLVNSEAQHSLWPSFAALPEGWDIAAPACSRTEALAYVEQNWTDLRPLSIR